MLQENEIIVLILSVGTLIAIKANFQRMSNIPRSSLLISSFIFFTFAAVFTNLEGLFWPEVLNIVEHLCVLVSSVILAVWAYLTGVKSR